MSLSPGTRRRQQDLARWARRTPGYRFALEEVLPRVRRSAVLTDLAWRVFAPRHGAGHVDVALHGGRYVEGLDVSRLPVVGILATGLTDADATALLDHVAGLQAELGSFRPLFLLDRPVFAAARRHGYVVEHLVPQDAWATGDFTAGRSGDPGSWHIYLARRVASVTDHYQLWHLLRVPAPEQTATVEGGAPGDAVTQRWLDPVDEAVLRHLGERLPEDLAVRLTDARP